MIFRALTVRQPYASAMFFGPLPKDVENRSRRPPEDLIGQRLWIHAGETLDVEGLKLCRRLGWNPVGFGDHLEATQAFARDVRRWEQRRPLPRGVILGSVLLDRCTMLHEVGSPWRDWRVEYAWILRDSQPLAVPIPVSGGGSLTLGWRVPEDVAAQIVAQERGELRAA
jgi:hypothetical protein